MPSEPRLRAGLFLCIQEYTDFSTKVHVVENTRTIVLDTLLLCIYSVCVVKKLKPAVKNWRATLDDVKLLAELKAKLGVVNETDVVRMGLRKLAEAEGLR